MSGICDTCRRIPCNVTMDGLRHCDLYESDETRYEKLFGTPERAARTLAENCSCGNCGACPASTSVCECGHYDALLEWLRGDAE